MAATSDASASSLSLKLLVDTKAGRVLYAEASKDVVDFLFSLLTLPVGTVVKLLSMDSMVGSLGNLYGSVEKLDETYVRSARARKALLAPAGGCAGVKVLELPETPAPPLPPCTQFYRCSNNWGAMECDNRVTKSCGSPCPRCGRGMMTVPVQLVGSNPGSGDDDATAAAMSSLDGAGFVQGVVTYTVMDDLKVAPMSTISGITLLNTFGITDIGTLQEKAVQLGYDEGFEILRVALQSKTVLTDVFLGKKRKA